jgi:hypothetical protein
MSASLSVCELCVRLNAEAMCRYFTSTGSRLDHLSGVGGPLLLSGLFEKWDELGGLVACLVATQSCRPGVDAHDRRGLSQ